MIRTIKNIAIAFGALLGFAPVYSGTLDYHKNELQLISSAHFNNKQSPENILSDLRTSTTQFNGIIDGEVWIYAATHISASANYTLEIPNSNIDTIEIFQVDKNNKVKRILFGGDHVPVSKQIGGLQSPFLHLFLDTGFHYFLIKYIQKGRYQHRLIYLNPITKFQHKKGRQLLVNGIFAGFCFFLLLLSLVLGFYLKQNIFYYYALWTALQILYFSISLGYFRYWFYPENTLINSTLRAFTSAIIPLIFALLTIEFLDENKSSKNIKKLLYTLISICIGLFIFERTFTDYFWENVTPWILITSIISIAGIITAAVVIIIYALKSWQKPLIIAICFALQLFLTSLLIWFESGPSVIDFLELYTYTGFLPILELISFGILIGWRMNETIASNNKLLKENLLLQTKSQVIHANSVEEERKRIAMDLHDTSLNRISILSMLLTSNSIESVKAGKEIASIGEEIRATAYSLYSPWLDALGFKEVIQREINHVIQTTQLEIHYKFYDWGTEPSEIQKRHIVRIIQEFIQNTLKHSFAKRIDLHLFERENLYLIEMEDNGVGYKTESIQTGLGILSVESRVQLLQGRIAISSNPGNGVNWLIEIPITPIL